MRPGRNQPCPKKPNASNAATSLPTDANPEIGSPSESAATCPNTDSGAYIPGTIRYSYTNAGDVASRIAPLPNQQADATVTTTYTYDALHRITNKSYTDGTVPVSYWYDTDTPSGCSPPSLTLSNNIGHMRAMCDGSGSTSWNYDNVGHVWNEKRTIGTVSDGVTYTYNPSGALSSVTYPASGNATPFSVNYHQNASGRIDTVTGSDNVTYGQVQSTWASGAPHVQQLGAGVQITTSLNSRLQLSASSAAQVSPNNTLFSQTYDYHEGNGDNGDLWAVSDALDALGLNRPNGSVNYTYDTLNRISSASTSGSDCTSVAGGTRDWGTNYSIDAWGNLVGKAVTKCSAYPFNTSADVRNRLVAATYDSAGNVVSKAGATFTYDAENRVSVGTGTPYSYDGMGERVRKTGTLYWKGSGSNALAETDESDSHPTRYIFFNGVRIARIEAGATGPKYYVTDNLGSTSIVTDAAGNILNESLFYPYGQEQIVAQADPQNAYRYTGKERDVETGLDDFGARYYDSSLGRFITPDWDAKASAVPYATFTDPQSLNLYSYVENAPVNRVDADGHVVNGGPAGVEPYLAGASSDWCAGADPVHCPGAYRETDPNPSAHDDIDDAKEAAANGQKPNASSPQQQTPTAAPAPTTQYKNVNAAGIAAEKTYNPASKNLNREFNGNIYKNGDGKCCFIQTPNIGTLSTSSPPDVSTLPSGSTRVATYHTHGADSHGVYDDEHFSPADIRNAGTRGVPIFVGTPQGVIRMYAPATKQITTFKETAP